ncbi:insulin receptor substrate 2 [Rhinatrema bivittatum]|uniref:insulin receptor substrate 2 n=1 Tax=Rhinatrema bivittatum TaxID=194408 RepID=UPI00112DA099|nr:insulin receptor substrate 2 [Rhinatrema bivittatum]
MASPPASGLLLPLSPGGGGTANPNSNNNNNSSGVKKCGYLRKHKHGHKRFFVLREAGGEGGGGGPARLEYYESEKKWRQKAAAAKRSIALDSCLNINKRADAKHKHLIALYTRDEYFALAADSEQEQESWYRALTELLSEGRAGGGGGGGGSCPDGPFPGHPSCSSSPASSSSCCLLSGAEDLNYGLITPASAAYREVWQVTLKPKGLGQSRNLTGVHRLCLSARAVAFVRLNAQAPAVTLQLSNVRRCGHSDSFFFVEVGRSAATGPGELWMQADDAVVAQNIHETILEAMRELAEFRPRSKSQSSSSSSSASNPITVPGRRHLNHPPPSQTGLARRSRTDSSSSSATAASSSSSSPASKFTSCRMRTASEGDGRPGPAAGSPLSPGAARPQHLSRSNTLGGRQGPKMVGPAGGLAHSRSSSSSIMPASQSPPAATSPVSLSSSSGHGSASDPLPRPFSCSASASGSPSDGGFLSLDEYGSSPGPRSATPESLAAGTTPPPPGREGAGELCGYMVMERPLRGGWRRPCREEAEAEKAQRKRTYSLTTPARQRAAPQLSSASLDERTLRAASSPKLPYHPYPEDYGDVEIGSSGSNSSSSNHHLAADDGGYMPMTPGAAPPAGQAPKGEDYVPMSPTSVSAPKLILQPRPCPQQQQHLHHHQRPLNGHKSASPAGSSPEDSGYMRMWCGSRLSVESPAGGGDYMNMSPHDHNCASVTPPDFFGGGGGAHLPKPAPPASLCYGAPLPAKKGDSDQYVFMNSPGQRIAEELARPPPPPIIHHHAVPSPDAFFQRAARPTRLALDTVRTLPSMHEHPLPPEPGSPGEYINIDFGRGGPPPPPPSQSPASSLGSGHHHQRSPLSDYMNLGFGSHSPKGGLASPGSPEEEEAMSPAPARPFLPAADGDYTEMTFGAAATPPQPIAAQKPDGAQLASPAAGVKRLTLVDQRPGGAAEAFARPPDPDRGAKVIRADPQGRRRHSSETFSSTTTVTPVSPSFAHNPKRHNSASVENVSLRKGEEGPGGGQEGPGGGAGGASPMCRHTSAGFQNGLNYIAIDVAEESRGFAAVAALHGLDIGAYARLGFGRHGLKEATAVKE